MQKCSISKMFFELLALLCLIVYFKTIYGGFTYWKTRNVAEFKPKFLFGDFLKVCFGLKHVGAMMAEAHNYFKKNRYGGLYFFNKPIFIVTDQKLIKSMLVKDFDYFVDRGIHCDTENDPLSGHLFNLEGSEWKFIRQKLTPTFTSAKLKNMFGLIEKHTDVLVNVLREGSTEDREVYNLLERLGMDIIGHVAFGLDCNTLKAENSDFYNMTACIFRPRKRDVLKLLLTDGFSNPGNLIKLVTADKKMCKFFYGLISDALKYRKENNVVTNDFLQLLIDLMDTSDSTALSIDQVAAQAFVFFIAAYETSSKTLNMCLYSLAKNQDIQDKVRDEISKELSKNDNKFSYDLVMNNKYIDMVIKETLRLHPPVLFLMRECNRNYKIPESDVTLEKGIVVMFSILGIHRDPENYPNPEAFDPNRFDENQSNVKPFSYMPFGQGPRNCIGDRFGYLQVKLTLCKLVKNYKFTISPKMEEPLTLDPITKSFLLNYKQSILLNIDPVT